MTKPTLNSSASSPTPDNGATCGELAESTDSLWQPSWLHWLISALSGTVEIEKQTAWLKKHNRDLRQENAKLRELESKLD
ncbi:MAG: hypothetical protein VKJ86_01710, partial [Synechococcus sp.]|nr:hypothetical protein [Synechococcus sp.]